MHRFLLALLLALVVAVGGACGGDGDDEAATPTVRTTVTTETGTEPATTEDDDDGDDGDDGDDDDDADDDSGNEAAGAQVFASAGCGSCHALAAANATGQVGPSLDDAEPDFDRVVETVTEGRGAMPSFSDQLSEQEIRDVAAFVSESASD